MGSHPSEPWWLKAHGAFAFLSLWTAGVLWSLHVPKAADGERIRYRRPMRVDLGGSAKGYAVDLAVRTLRDAGMEITADALTKIVLFAAPHCAQRALSQFSAQAYVLDPQSEAAA